MANFHFLQYENARIVGEILFNNFKFSKLKIIVETRLEFDSNSVILLEKKKLKSYFLSF